MTEWTLGIKKEVKKYLNTKMCENVESRVISMKILIPCENAIDHGVFLQTFAGITL